MMQELKLIKVIYFLTTLGFLIMLSSCQKEFIDVQEPNSNETISSNDNVFALILNVTLKDGSFDNVIDKCNGISIKFPYKIQIDEKSLTVSTKQDIDNVKLNDGDDIEIIFPITIIFSDYSEKIIYNEDELETIQEQFNEIINDDDNECIDFVYPIELSLYNTIYQKLENVKVMDDKNMFAIFSQISDIIVEIKYPIYLMTLEGISIKINNNEEVENEIYNTIGKCDEKDETDFDEGNENEVNQDGDTVTDEENETGTNYDNQNLFEILSTGDWMVSLYTDTKDETSLFNPYILTFRTDSTVFIKEKEGTKSFVGSWELDESDNNISTIDIDSESDVIPLVWLNEEWDIVNLSNNKIEMQAESDSEGFTKRLNLSKSE